MRSHGVVDGSRRFLGSHLGNADDSSSHPPPRLWLSTKRKRRGEYPGVSDIRFRSRKRSASGQRPVEQPSCPSQRILDLGEVTNRHRLEYEPIDVGFQVVQYHRAGAIAPSWLHADRSGGLLTRSPKFLACGTVLGFLVFARRLPVRPSDALILSTTVLLMVPSNPAACHALFTAATLPWGWSFRNSFTNIFLPGLRLSWTFWCRDFALAAVLGFDLAAESQLLSHLVDEGVTDCPVHPGSRPRLVHGFDVALGIVLEKLLDETALALVSRLLLPRCNLREGLSFVQFQLEPRIRLHGQRNSHELQERAGSSVG